MTEKKVDGRKSLPQLFKKGQSGNPAGRPKGSVNKYTELSRALLSERGPEIVNVVIEKALKGDVHCLKMCMDRIVPPQKAVEIKHTKDDGGLVINVGTTDQIEEMSKNKTLKDVEVKSDDQVVAEIVKEE